jgi:hypothetical protein
MKENINLKEIEIILGLKDHSDELNKIINDKKDLSFLEAITNILYSDNLNKLYESNDIQEKSDNNMIDNFIQKAEIDNICPIKLELYKNSNFIDNIKGNDTFLKIPNIDYSDSYISKLKKDFVKEENIIMPPIEIKEQQNAKRKDNKMNKYNKKNTMPNISKQTNKDIIQNENIEIENKIKENEFENEEEKKEIKKTDENKENDIEFEEEEKYSDKKNEGNNNYHQNNNRPYNKKYNRNKTNKEYRQKVNSRRFKNYK